MRHGHGNTSRPSGSFQAWRSEWQALPLFSPIWSCRAKAALTGYLRADQGRAGAPGLQGGLYLPSGMCIPLQNDWKWLDSELREGKRRCGDAGMGKFSLPSSP